MRADACQTGPRGESASAGAHDAVGTGEQQGLVAVVESYDVWWRAIRAANFHDFSGSLRDTDRAAVDQYSIADLCLHNPNYPSAVTNVTSYSRFFLSRRWPMIRGLSPDFQDSRKISVTRSDTSWRLNRSRGAAAWSVIGLISCSPH